MTPQLEAAARLQIAGEAEKALQRRYEGRAIDTVTALSVLNDAKQMVVRSLLDRGWTADEAWERVSKMAVEESDGTVSVTDGWDG